MQQRLISLDVKDSVASPLNEGVCGCVCEAINQPVLFVIKVIQDRHMSV